MVRTGFLGAGNMAFAIAGAVSERLEDIIIIPWDVDQERIELFKKSFPRVEETASAEELSKLCDVIFLSVKPQMMEEALGPLRNYKGLAVSIAAGLKLSFFERLLPGARIIRVMPNTPCLVGEMAAGYSAGANVTSEDTALAGRLLEAAGKAFQVDEQLIDAVTGLSGSGPAFFARIAEAFIMAGEEMGLEPELARELTLQTMKGTAVLLQEKNMSPGNLVKMVSSPGGTTIAGREILESSAYREIISKTVARAVERSKELGK